MIASSRIYKNWVTFIRVLKGLVVGQILTDRVYLIDSRHVPIVHGICFGKDSWCWFDCAAEGSVVVFDLTSLSHTMGHFLLLLFWSLALQAMWSVASLSVNNNSASISSTRRAGGPTAIPWVPRQWCGGLRRTKIVSTSSSGPKFHSGSQKRIWQNKLLSDAQLDHVVCRRHYADQLAWHY